MNIIWKQPDGSIAITTIIADTSTAAEAARLQANGDIPADWEMVAENTDIFLDRHWRDAWEWKAGKPAVNHTRAVNLTKERLRREREPLLKELDVEHLRLLETGASTQALVARKQALRDITNQATPNKTLDELKNLKAE